MKRKYLTLMIVLASVAGCSAKYTLDPPTVDLTGYASLGLVEFKAENAKGDIDSVATQYFLQYVTGAQRVPVVELGSAGEVLAGVGKTSFNREAALAVGEAHGVDVFFLGEVKVSKVKPQVDLLAPLSKAAFVRAKFDIAVTVRLISAKNGATVWTQSNSREGTVGSMAMGPDGVPTFSMQGQDEATAGLLRDMMYQLTWDFRATRRRL